MVDLLTYLQTLAFAKIMMELMNMMHFLLCLCFVYVLWAYHCWGYRDLMLGLVVMLVIRLRLRFRIRVGVRVKVMMMDHVFFLD